MKYVYLYEGIYIFISLKEKFEGYYSEYWTNHISGNFP